MAGRGAAGDRTPSPRRRASRAQPAPRPPVVLAAPPGHACAPAGSSSRLALSLVAAAERPSRTGVPVAVTLSAVGAGARAAWRSALATDPDALVFQTPEWTDCICASGSYEDATRAYATSDDHHLVLPLLRRRLPGP